MRPHELAVLLNLKLQESLGYVLKNELLVLSLIESSPHRDQGVSYKELKLRSLMADEQLTKVLRSLCQAKLATRHTDFVDRRVRRYTISEAGSQILGLADKEIVQQLLKYLRANLMNEQILLEGQNLD